MAQVCSLVGDTDLQAAVPGCEAAERSDGATEADAKGDWSGEADGDEGPAGLAIATMAVPAIATAFQITTPPDRGSVRPSS